MMRHLPRLLMTTALTISLALPATAQQIETVRLDRPSASPGSPVLSGLLLALIMVGVAGLGSDGGDEVAASPNPGPDPNYVPPGG